MELKIYLESSNKEINSGYSFYRQSDSSSCQSDALYYLQRALRLDSFLSHVSLIKDDNEEFDLFHDIADLSLTSQSTRFLKKNNIHDDTLLKVYTKKQKTFLEKSGGKKPVIKQNMDESSSNKVQVFFERTFLNEVGAKYKKIIDQKVEFMEATVATTPLFLGPT